MQHPADKKCKNCGVIHTEDKDMLPIKAASLINDKEPVFFYFCKKCVDIHGSPEQKAYFTEK